MREGNASQGEASSGLQVNGRVLPASVSIVHALPSSCTGLGDDGVLILAEVD